MSEVVLNGEVTKIIFAKPPFHIALVKGTVNGQADVYKIIGEFPAPTVGARYEIQGRPEYDRNRSPQIRVTTMTPETPSSLPAIESYLSTLKGMGPSVAKMVVTTFGDDTLDVIKTNPRRLLEVRGVGEARLKMIIDSWAELQGSHDLGLIVTKAGLGPATTARILTAFEKDALTIVTTTPYRVMEITGIGWAHADAIARAVGIAPDAPERIIAAMAHLISEAESEGHCYLVEDDLVLRVHKLIHIPFHSVSLEIGTATSGDDSPLIAELVGMDTVIYTRSMHRTEQSVATRMRTLLSAPTHRGDDDPLIPVLGWSSADWSAVAERNQLNEMQAAAVKAAFQSNVSILTGGPGTGKTYTVKTIVDIAEKHGATVKLAAPTGKAAKKLGTSTSRDAETIHRMLGRGDVSEQVLVIDEMSMVDIYLMSRLLHACQSGTHIVLVGDVDQLPSVGPGRVLLDLIESGRIPVTRLTEIHRQSASSGIVTASHAINHGEYPAMSPISALSADRSDMYFVPVDGPDAAAGTTVDLVCDRLPAVLGVDRGDIQVLAPMRRGADGVFALNARLQHAQNGFGEIIPVTQNWEQPLRVGDRVIHTRNNYELEVFNGTTGMIVGHDEAVDDAGKKTHHTIVVTDDGETIKYENKDVGQLQLAYALTIHKSQGSEYPVVVLVLTSSSHIMHRSNLAYTAVTRGRHTVVMVGTQAAMRRCVTEIDTRTRNTQLTDRIVTL